ncbi:fatty acyl-AMP ligase [Levilinea saccharolytica]|uniref:Acyl-CoA synthetase n=1 Tax=Levilinea saccharolytica TaxID=229921 RepID=A0A0M8JR57_9CHLR|nr:fatty acyl-AMP ligase [Levilinea saccharolytica]KPL87414.1 hypothetical protein ADN01_04395 [Levilinea saccharolytica]GAP19758.1 acyl-CoA synthetase [Levilinea saccharolytica]
MTTFAEVLRQYHRETPERVCMVLQHSGQEDRKVTYRELLEGANAHARSLQAAGIQPGEVVILILQHGSDLVFSFFGAVLHGAIPSIMPFLTEKLLPERYRADLASLVSITRPAAIITYPEFEAEVRAALHPGDSVRAVLLADQVEPPSAPDFDQLQGLRRTPQDIVLLQHSSGTTGLQKGVALSHQAVFNQLAAYQQALHLDPEQDVIVSWLPLYHDMGLIAGFLQPVLTRTLLVMMSPFEWVRAPQRLLTAVSQYRGTLSWLPNFAYNFCAQKIRDRHLEGVDLSSWRAVINCSEPVRYESHRAFLERFAPHGFRPQALAASYAMAENVFGVTQGGIDAPLTVDIIDREAFQVERVARPCADGEGALKMVSCGRPLSNTQVRILSAEGQELPERHVGEVALHSDCMLTGYYNRPDETAKAFRGEWYLTGDYGYLADGELYVSGRKKDLIIVGGKNIYPQDLENLAMSVPGVHAGRVSAFGVDNPEAGTEDVVIVAEVDSEDPQVREQIADGIRQAVTRGSAVALRSVYLVGPQWLVKTSSGKNARLANREKFLKETAEQD